MKSSKNEGAYIFLIHLHKIYQSAIKFVKISAFHPFIHKAAMQTQAFRIQQIKRSYQVTQHHASHIKKYINLFLFMEME